MINWIKQLFCKHELGPSFFSLGDNLKDDDYKVCNKCKKKGLELI